MSVVLWNVWQNLIRKNLHGTKVYLMRNIETAITLIGKDLVYPTELFTLGSVENLGNQINVNTA